MNLISYVFNTIIKEIREDIQIVKEIFNFHVEEVYEAIDLNRTKNLISKRMKMCQSYQQWLALAEEFDNLLPSRIYRQKVYSRYYDYLYVGDLLKLLKETRKGNKVEKLIAIMRSHSFRNIGNLNSPMLYRELFSHTKSLIEDFQKEVSKCLKTILRCPQLSLQRKIQFFSEMRHAIGRTALLLSGGALMGMYHIGVVLALKEAGITPRILAGSSAGSIISACIATRSINQTYDHTHMNYAAFPLEQRRSMWWHLKRFFREGYMMDSSHLIRFLRDNIGQLTFQEAYDKTGWILNITVTGVGQHDENRLLNYLTAPNVLIWSACAASCAIPYVFGATDVFCKNADGEIETYVPFQRKFVDGSIGADLPMENLSVLFNVNNFIVSQTNPWVAPFMDFTDETKTSRSYIVQKILIVSQKIKSMILAQMKHRFSQLIELGFLPSVLQRFLNIFSQTYVGHVTIWPKFNIMDYVHLMRMPTNSNQLQRFVQAGRLRTYPKISRIKAMMHFEIQIERCLKKAKYLSMSRLNLNVRMGEASVVQKDSLVEEQDQIVFRKAESNRRKMNRNSSFINPRELTNH